LPSERNASGPVGSGDRAPPFGGLGDPKERLMSTLHRLSPAITLSALALSGLLITGCTSSSGAVPGIPGSGGVAPASSGHCSDPDPSPLALTFAGVVCIVGQSTVTQPDGSTELKIRVSVTDKDPNAFDVTSIDFSVQDGTGHSTPAEDGSARDGSSDCIAHSFTDTGWPLQPGQAFTAPGPFCFHIEPGQQPTALVWQDDVTVRLG
jgi:hypothetical protein